MTACLTAVVLTLLQPCIILGTAEHILSLAGDQGSAWRRSAFVLHVPYSHVQVQLYMQRMLLEMSLPARSIFGATHKSADGC
jgi:hypothetical protein